MNKQYILTVVVLVLLAGATAGVYQFYFKERLEQYADNRQKKDAFEKKLASLQSTFSGTNPEAVVSLWTGAINPWKDALAKRTGYFNMDEVYTNEPIPEEAITRFYYEQESIKLITQIQSAAYTRNPPCELPGIVYSFFGAPQMSQLTGQQVSKEDVNTWLTQIRLGCQVTKLLLDAKAITIHDIVLWPPRKVQDVLELHTAGLSFNTTLDNLVAFMDRLRTSDRFFQVNAFSFTNRYLMYSPDPVVEVQLLITQGRYLGGQVKAGEAVTAAATAPGPGAAPAAFTSLRTTMRGGREATSSTASRTSTTTKKSWWQKLWPFS